MRNAPTPAEKKLWGHLRASRLDGVKFSRQIAIGPFIADFCARSRKLIVEVDGSQHGEIEDVRRTRWLEREGYIVVRFTNRQVLVETEGVLMVIVAACRDCPPLTPPVPGGESASVEVSPDIELPY
ncbi:endonuclease domain-containing protein [Glacieibacterium frigidum]|uniref:Endonuclease domain-containing protein n=2 Tax=Glacieibacterium frigidum TaxID=2593303 RepID=A0A552UJK3_9SPHN|nr:endonuclease domain-containing protein [Glacieibacterium frigidum]